MSISSSENMENSEENSTSTAENPAEENEDEDERMWAAISFVVILIVFGVPLWWKMTEVERSFFPYNEIAELHSRNIVFHLRIDVKTSSISAENLVNDLENLFVQSTLFKVNLSISSPPSFLNKSVIELEKITEFHPHQPGYYQLVEMNSASIRGNITIGKHRTVYITPNCGAKDIHKFFAEIILNEKLLLESVKTVISPGVMSENTHYLRKVRPSPKYDVIFSVVNPQPEDIDFQWDNELYIKKYFRPFLRKLHLLSDFRVKSQWLYLLDWHQTPKKEQDRFELNHLQIPHIITPLEKKIVSITGEVDFLSIIDRGPVIDTIFKLLFTLRLVEFTTPDFRGSGVAQNPCINFVLFVTKCEYAPTVFVDENAKTSNAILSARWGGVQLVNPNATNCQEHVAMTVNPWTVMQVFLVQFKTLLGLNDWSSRTDVLAQDFVDIHAWEIDSLYRMRILEQFISSRITLTSLSQLLGEISNIVITDEVGDAVLESVTAIDSTLQALSEGQLIEALNFSTQSFVASEFAFTHPSLLALLYFPDDQKYAVYIPLYLPVMIPVLLSLKNIFAWLKKKRANSQEKTKTD